MARENIEKWLSLLQNKWWGIFAVYVSVAAMVFVAIWTAIEPLEIPMQINIFGNTIDRRLVHIIITLLFASHFTLILVTIYRLQESGTHSNTLAQKVIPIHDREFIQSLQNGDKPLKKNELMVNRVRAVDGKISTVDFARQVLFTLKCGEITENFAGELLRGMPILINRREGYTYALDKNDKS